ncbi:MAG: transposase [Urechidicola sp.]|nr:transposase [Urechidicola sp.]
MKLEVLHKDNFYHVYNRGINRCNIFMNDENKRYFINLIDKYLKAKVSLLAYCLMDNHFHLIVEIKANEKDVTQSFSNLLNAYAKAFNKQNNRTGSLFEKHFKRIKIHNEEYLKALILYVHLNPEHHTGVGFENYGFSSYKSILNGEGEFGVLNLFDDVENFKFCHQQKSDLLTQKFTFE